MLSDGLNVGLLSSALSCVLDDGVLAVPELCGCSPVGCCASLFAFGAFGASGCSPVVVVHLCSLLARLVVHQLVVVRPCSLLVHLDRLVCL